MKLTGTLIKDRYCILDSVGKGGEGKVYLARDMELGVLRAVKEIPQSGRKEARMLLKLCHPALPRVMDYMEKDQNCYIVMEYIKGQSLGELLQKKRFLTLDEVLQYGMEIADVLEYLHERKPPIYYGDLKPDNIMQGENSRLYLIDLGSAVNGYKEKQKICKGTRGFAAPEQYEGYMDKTSDIYAFGKTLRELLGVQKRSWMLIFRDVSLWWFLMRCCQRIPDFRYRNMNLVRKKIAGMQQKQRKKKRKWLVPAGAALGMCLLVQGGTEQKTSDFYGEITTITNLYQQENFVKGSRMMQMEICAAAEKKLIKLREIYKEREEMRKIGILLAVNSEYEKKYEKTEQYYKDLLKNDWKYAEGYGEYGMFLIRTGQKEKAENLWNRYKEIQELADESTGRNLMLWTEEMKKSEEK